MWQGRPANALGLEHALAVPVRPLEQSRGCTVSAPL